MTVTTEWGFELIPHLIMSSYRYEKYKCIGFHWLWFSVDFTDTL